mmetsp:Transcript_24068/g.33836  ORF Transcript_24068/g.33836 Transcript_24068/m.33836 type:complete len:87 (+) Transcript_24068:1233-1493(+)
MVGCRHYLKSTKIRIFQDSTLEVECTILYRDSLFEHRIARVLQFYTVENFEKPRVKLYGSLRRETSKEEKKKRYDMLHIFYILQYV